MSIPERARELRKLIENAATSLTDQQASTGPEIFPALKADGSLIRSGTRINWHGTLKRAAVDLWDTADNTPHAAPELWEDIAYRDGIRIIPQTITAGLAFALGEKGWWGDVLYESMIPANTYTPEQYPDGWKKAAL